MLLHFCRGYFSRIYGKRLGVIILATMFVDLDHLWARPILKREGVVLIFHPLHSFYPVVLYFFMLFIPYKYVRINAVGLLFHMFTDFQDCLWIGKTVVEIIGI